MTKRECIKYIKELQRDLSLGEWSIVVVAVDTDELDGVAWARVYTHTNRLEAIVQIAMRRTPDEIRQSLAHEMAHLSLNDMREIFYATVDKLAGDEAAKKAVEFIYAEAEERVCHRVGRALSGVFASDKVPANFSDIISKRL